VNLAGLVYNGTPNETEIKADYECLGLPDVDYLYFGKYYSELPFIAHADWEHLLRTARKNLHRPRTSLCFGVKTWVQRSYSDFKI
jgi:hypothetical protein